LYKGYSIEHFINSQKQDFNYNRFNTTTPSDHNSEELTLSNARFSKWSRPLVCHTTSYRTCFWGSHELVSSITRGKSIDLPTKKVHGIKKANSSYCTHQVAWRWLHTEYMANVYLQTRVYITGQVILNGRV